MNLAAWARAALAQSGTLQAWRFGRWGLGWTVFATLAAAFLFVLLSIGVWVLLRSLTDDTSLAASFTAATTDRAGLLVGNPFTLVNFLSIGLIGLAVVWAAAWVQGRSLVDYITLGGSFDGTRFWRMAGAFALIQVVSLPFVLAFTAESVTWRAGAFANPVFLIACIALIAVQSFGEELFFRGFLHHAWGAVLPRPVPVAIAGSAFFALLHAWNPDIQLDPVPGLLSTFLFGLFAQWLVARTGSLDAAWGLHFANNIVALLLAQAKPGYDSDTSLIEYTDSVLIRGGSYAADPLYHLTLFGGFALLVWLAADRRSPFFLEPAPRLSDDR